MNSALAQLLHNPLLWRGDQLSHVVKAVPSGFALLDRELPGAGWPKGTLTELLLDEEGIGEMRLLLPALQRLARAGEWIALVAPPHIPYAPAFAASSIDPGRVIIIDTAQIKDRWWAAEQVLRANSAGALLFWPESSHDFRISDQRLRRLQLAAQDGESLAFLFSGTARAVQSSPAPLRIRRYAGQTTTLLKEVSPNSLQFSMFQRNPVGGSVDQYATTDPTLCKVVQMSWTCSRNILGKKTNTESVQSAKIALRNN